MVKEVYSSFPSSYMFQDLFDLLQVIAFLQSKGKVQGESGEISRSQATNITQDIQLPQNGSIGPKTGQLRGSIRRPFNPATTSNSELILKSQSREVISASPRVPGKLTLYIFMIEFHLFISVKLCTYLLRFYSFYFFLHNTAKYQSEKVC